MKDAEVTVTFMQKAGRDGKFKWPKAPDRQTLPESELLCRLLAAPTPSGRSSRIFQVAEWQHIDELANQI